VVLPRLCLLAFTICQALLLNRLLRFLDAGPADDDIRVGYGLIGAYGLVYVGIAVSGSFYYHRAVRAAIMLRGLLMAAVFTKTTEVQGAKGKDAAAVTLMSSDVSP